MDISMRSRKKVEPDIQKFGKPGSVIPGSKLFRAYRGCCGQPVRVTPGNVRDDGTSIEDCYACKAGLMIGHGSQNYVRDDGEDGSWANVVAANEGD